MKTFLAILLSLVLAACADVPPPSPPPSPPAPVVTGHYIIKEFSGDGAVLRVWITDNYSESSFPRRVTFTADGKQTTLSGSYEIRKMP